MLRGDNHEDLFEEFMINLQKAEDFIEGLIMSKAVN